LFFEKTEIQESDGTLKIFYRTPWTDGRGVSSYNLAEEIQKRRGKYEQEAFLKQRRSQGTHELTEEERQDLGRKLEAVTGQLEEATKARTQAKGKFTRARTKLLGTKESVDKFWESFGFDAQMLIDLGEWFDVESMTPVRLSGEALAAPVSGDIDFLGPLKIKLDKDEEEMPPEDTELPASADDSPKDAPSSPEPAPEAETPAAPTPEVARDPLEEIYDFYGGEEKYREILKSNNQASDKLSIVVIPGELAVQPKNIESMRYHLSKAAESGNRVVMWQSSREDAAVRKARQEIIKNELGQYVQQGVLIYRSATDIFQAFIKSLERFGIQDRDSSQPVYFSVVIDEEEIGTDDLKTLVYDPAIKDPITLAFQGARNRGFNGLKVPEIFRKHSGSLIVKKAHQRKDLEIERLFASAA